MASQNPRVDQLRDEFGSESASAAWLFCDRHDPAAVAFTVSRDGKSTELTYGELRDSSLRLAASLRGRGIGEGDRVASLVRKGPELVITMLAAWRLGAVYVPLFTAFAEQAIAFRLARADVAVIVTDAAQRPKLDAAQSASDGASSRLIVTVDPPSADGDVAFADLVQSGDPEYVQPFAQGGLGAIVHTFTSGTTGDPKGVIHPLSYAAGWDSYLEFGLGVGSDDHFWCAADPGWAYGLYAGIISPLSRGCGNILQDGGFSVDETWRILTDHGVTNFAAAPTVYRALRNAPESIPDRSALRLQKLSSAGEPLTPEINVWSEEAFGLAVHDHFGQTEVGMVFANHHHPSLAADIIEGSMGQPLPGWTAVVLGTDDQVAAPGEVGRIAIDTTSEFMTFRSYQEARKSAKRFTPDGRYFILGDLGRIDNSGYVHFSSRDDDVILMAGYRIGPFEVEKVISRHPDVAECAVVAAPDPLRGEVVEAFVVVAGGAARTSALADELKAAVKNGYSAHAYPRTIHFVDSLPKTPSGKIQRFVLREQRRRELDERKDA